MTPEQLKASIFQYAIQGKLVEQRNEEGTGEDLYNQIVKERNKLIASKIMKKVKIEEEIEQENIPFDIPKSWKWVKIGMLEEINLGFTYRPEYTEEGVHFLSVKDISGGSIDFSKAKKVSQETYDNAAYGSKPRLGDILFGRVGTIGKPQIIETDEPFCIFVSLGFFRDYTNLMNKKYVSYWMETPLFNMQVSKNVKGAAQKNLNTNWLKDFLIPLPPLKEQQRIVERIKELLPHVERYAVSYEKLEQINAKFPEDMKKSILQYAIQGKLVEQRPEEGNANELYQQIQKEKQKRIKEGKIKKEKPLAEITEEEIPFEIPDSWKWCRLSQIIDVRDGTHDSPKYVSKGIPLVTSKNLLNGTIDFENVKYITKTDADKINERSFVDNNDILFAMIGSIGNPVLVKKSREFCIKNMALFKKYENTNVDMNYLYWFLYFAQYELKAEASGGVQAFISLKRFREYLIPLPPLEEQKRIVAKIEELLLYCDML